MRQKVAFLFPGQGKVPVALPPPSAVGERLFALAKEKGLPLKEWIRDCRFDLLRRTEYAQAAILIDSLAKEETLREQEVEPIIVAGHSLGEYAALVSAGLLTPEEALSVVTERGRLMGRVDGAMAAILKLPIEEVEEICRRIGPKVVIANYNSPTQIVISGEREAIKAAVAMAERDGGRGVILRVSGPFHSPLMAQAQAALAPAIEALSFRTPSIPVISSVSGRVETEASSLKGLLLTQITACVRWVDVVESLEKEEVARAIEAGPGEVLTGLGRRITSKVRFLRFEEGCDG